MLLPLNGCKTLPGLDFLPGSESGDPAQVENKPVAYRFRVGDHYTFDNPITRWQVVAIKGGQVLWRSNEGDRQVTGFNPLLPAREWWSRKGGAGRRNIRDQKGALFPMKVGATMSFRATVTSSKPPFGWEYFWSCRVTGRETVKVLDDAIETFVVVCGRENPNELTFNYAPEVGHYVVQRVAATADSPARMRKLLTYKHADAVSIAGNTAAPGKPPSKPAAKSPNSLAKAAARENATSEDNPERLGRASFRAVDSLGESTAVSTIQNALDSVSLRTPDFGGNIAPKSRKAVSAKTGTARAAEKNPVAREPMVAPPPSRPRDLNAATSKPAVLAVPKRVPARRSTPVAAVPPPPKPVAKTPVSVPPPLAGPRIGAAVTPNIGSRPVPAPPKPVAMPSVPAPPPIRPLAGNTLPAVPVPQTPPVTGAQAGGGSRMPAGVHLASYRDAANARRGWKQLARRNGDLLRGLRADIRRIDVGEKGVYYRLYAAPVASIAAAKELCRKLRQRGVFCEPESS